MILDYQQQSIAWYVDDNVHVDMYNVLLVNRLKPNYAVRGIGWSNVAVEVLGDGPAAAVEQA